MSISTSLVPESRRDEGNRSSQTKTEEQFLSGALKRAKASSCPNCQGHFVVSASTGRAFEMNCKSWSCPICSPRRKAVAVELISGGVARARVRGERVRFLTLTAPPNGLAMSELYLAWNRLRATFRKSGELLEYCAVVELGSERRPVPHLHVLATGTFIPQKRLSTAAKRAGFGRITDIRAVRGTGDERAIAYLTKGLATQLVGYLSKSETSRLSGVVASEASTAKRVQIRPVRVSRQWYPGGFKAAEEALRARVAEQMGSEGETKDPGPWYIVLRRTDGGLSIVTRPKPASQLSADDERGTSASESTSEPEARAALAGEWEASV